MRNRRLSQGLVNSIIPNIKGVRPSSPDPLFLCLIMPANRFNGFTDYGIGIGLRIPHYQHIFERKPVVDWFEIISENFMVDGGRPLPWTEFSSVTVWSSMVSPCISARRSA